MKPIFRTASHRPAAQRRFDKSLLTVTTSLGSLHLIPLMIPLLLEQIFNNLISTANTAVLSGYSEEAVVATGTIGIIYTLFTVFFSGISIGVSIVISNYIGAEELRRAQTANWTSVVLCGTLALVGTVLIYAGSPTIARWMNLTGTVAELAVVYLRIMICSLVFLAVSTVMLAIMRCYGYPKYAVFTGVIKNLCNLAFSFYAVNYATHPALSGVHGVALGSVVSQLIALAIVLIMFLRLKLRMRIPESPRVFFTLTTRLLTVGIPACISSASFTLSQVLTNSFAMLLGVHAASAKIYLSNILNYAFLFSSSLGNANSLLVGRLYGAGNYEHARRLCRMLVPFSVTGNMILSFSIFLLRRPLLSLFTDNAIILQMSVGILLVDVLVELARAFSQIYEYALRSTGDVTPTMVVTLISGWVFSVGLAYVLSVPCQMGLIGCWIGLAIDEWIRTGYTFYRWKTGKWLPKSQSEKQAETALPHS